MYWTIAAIIGLLFLSCGLLTCAFAAFAEAFGSPPGKDSDQDLGWGVVLTALCCLALAGAIRLLLGLIGVV